MVTTTGPGTTQLHIGADHTHVATPHGAMVLNLGSAKTARAFFKHMAPTPLEMENAIMAVEDEVVRAEALAHPACPLHTSDPAIREIALLAGVADSAHMELSVDAVERQFDLLAAYTLGRPATSAGIPTDLAFAANLLILREFMHHLKFPSITVDTPVQAPAQP